MRTVERRRETPDPMSMRGGDPQSLRRLIVMNLEEASRDLVEIGETLTRGPFEIASPHTRGIGFGEQYIAVVEALDISQRRGHGEIRKGCLRQHLAVVDIEFDQPRGVADEYRPLIDGEVHGTVVMRCAAIAPEMQRQPREHEKNQRSGGSILVGRVQKRTSLSYLRVFVFVVVFQRLGCLADGAVQVIN